MIHWLDQKTREERNRIIVELRKRGLKIRQIAEQVGASRTTVQKVVEKSRKYTQDILDR